MSHVRRTEDVSEQTVQPIVDFTCRDKLEGGWFRVHWPSRHMKKDLRSDLQYQNRWLVRQSIKLVWNRPTIMMRTAHQVREICLVVTNGNSAKWQGIPFSFSIRLKTVNAFKKDLIGTVRTLNGFWKASTKIQGESNCVGSSKEPSIVSSSV